MLNVLIRNKVDNFDFYTVKEEITKINLTEKEITTALEAAGVKAFNGMNVNDETYQTMPGWIHINLHFNTLTETLMKGLTA